MIDATVTEDSWNIEWTCECGHENEDNVWDFDEDLECGKCHKKYRVSDDSDVPDNTTSSIELVSEDDEVEE